jgi:D-glycero-alpha-D-manno-heptose 1-phosphate guanylyltransferase
MITAVVLAGGLGTRLRSEVPDLPKPMAPVNGRPFLEYLLDYWSGQGIERFVLSVGYMKETVIQHFGQSHRGAKIDYVSEEVPLGTGGGVLLAAQKIPKDERFLLLNGDTFFAVGMTDLCRQAAQQDADCCFALFRSGEAGRYMGLELDAAGQVMSLRSGRSDIGSLANGGVYCLRRQVLMEDRFPPGSKVSLEDDIFPAAIGAQRRLTGIEYAGTFIDIGLPGDYRRAANILEKYAA